MRSLTLINYGHQESTLQKQLVVQTIIILRKAFWLYIGDDASLK